jgi:carbonic anhydrase
MQYAGTHLKTPLFIVLGHEGCGAVRAALQMKFHGARDRSISTGVVRFLDDQGSEVL